MQRQMPYSHPAYKVKKSDTLAGVSERLGVDEDVWITYHNKMCPVSRWIWRDSFPVNTEEIYLPPELWEKADALNSDASNKEIRGERVYRNTGLDFGNILSSVHHRNYGVSVKYFKEEESTPYKRIDYDAKITLTPDRNIYIEKNNVYYNRHEPDTVSEIVASIFAKSIYPVRTIINGRGLSRLEVLNREEILQRFNVHKNKLVEKYSSKHLEELMTKFEERLQHPRYLQNIFRNDWFCNLLFHPKILDYKESEGIDIRLALSVVPYGSPVIFEGKQKLTEQATYYDSHIITFNSKEQPASAYFIPKKANNDERYYMALNVIFDIDVHHNFSMHTRASLSVFGKDAKNYRKEIKRIEYTQYQQNMEKNGSNL
jgi:hypothetical protein